MRKLKICTAHPILFGLSNREERWTGQVPRMWGEERRIITVRLTFLGHSVPMRPNFQGLPWFECDGLGEDELLIRFLLN